MQGEILFSVAQVLTWSTMMAIGLAMGVLIHKAWGDPAPSQGRFDFIEGLRALSALGVVATHVGTHVVFRLGYEDRAFLTAMIGIVGVKIFFAITAFLFTRRLLKGQLNPIPFLENRVRRLVPLYLFVCMAALLMLPYVWTVKEQPLSQWVSEVYRLVEFGFAGAPQVKVNGFDMLQLVGIAWTLSYEWSFYLSLFMLGVFLQSRMLMAFAMVIALMVLVYRPAGTVWAFFLPGILIAVLETRILNAGPRLRRLATWLLLPLFVLVVTRPSRDGFTPLDLLFVTPFILCLFVSRPAILSCSPLIYLGRISYSIYLLQYLLIAPLALVTYRYSDQLPHAALKIAVLTLALPLLIPLAHWSFRFIELPWIRPPGKGAGSHGAKLTMRLTISVTCALALGQVSGESATICQILPGYA